MYCSNCGVSVPEGIKYCPKCGAAIVTLDSQQPQQQSPATRTYENEPCVQNVSYTQLHPYRRRVSMAPSVLSLIFSIVSVIFAISAIYLSVTYYRDPDVDTYITLSIISMLPSSSLGIVGLIKGIKNKVTRVIVVSVIGLAFVLLSICLISTIDKPY